MMRDDEIAKHQVLMRLIGDYCEQTGTTVVHAFVPEWMWPWCGETHKSIDGDVRVMCFRCYYPAPMFYRREEAE